MSRNLLLLRHGKSDWAVPCDDFHRPLKKRGVVAATRIGQWLAQQGLKPARILSSPAARAWETARLTCQAGGINTEYLEPVEPLYLADWRALLAIVQQEIDYADTLMIVGHNPAMEDTLVHLLGRAPGHHKDGKIFPTGTLAHFTFKRAGGSASLEKGDLRALVRAKELNLPPLATGQVS